MFIHMCSLYHWIRVFLFLAYPWLQRGTKLVYLIKTDLKDIRGSLGSKGTSHLNLKTLFSEKDIRFKCAILWFHKDNWRYKTFLQVKSNKENCKVFAIVKVIFLFNNTMTQIYLSNKVMQISKIKICFATLFINSNLIVFIILNSSISIGERWKISRLAVQQNREHGNSPGGWLPGKHKAEWRILGK